MQLRIDWPRDQRILLLLLPLSLKTVLEKWLLLLRCSHVLLLHLRWWSAGLECSAELLPRAPYASHHGDSMSSGLKLRVEATVIRRRRWMFTTWKRGVAATGRPRLPREGPGFCLWIPRLLVIPRCVPLLLANRNSRRMHRYISR